MVAIKYQLCISYELATFIFYDIHIHLFISDGNKSPSIAALKCMQIVSFAQTICSQLFPAFCTPWQEND